MQRIDIEGTDSDVSRADRDNLMAPVFSNALAIELTLTVDNDDVARVGEDHRLTHEVRNLCNERIDAVPVLTPTVVATEQRFNSLRPRSRHVFDIILKT